MLTIFDDVKTYWKSLESLDYYRRRIICYQGYQIQNKIEKCLGEDRTINNSISSPYALLTNNKKIAMLDMFDCS